ncbi:MAG: S8 family serine peptidase, partial [Planctomycetaceae bacterium]
MRRLTSWNTWGTGKFARDQRKLARQHGHYSSQVEQLEDRLLLSATGLPANAMGPAPAPTYTDFIIGGQDGFLSSYMAAAGVSDGVTPIGNDLYTVSVPDAVNLAHMQTALANNPFVDYVEPDYEINLALTPNDPRFTSGELWGLHNGGSSGGVVDADIDAPDAWDLTTGSTQFGIGVIDTGIDYTHEDLYLNIWLNQAEIPSGKSGVADIDSDGLITFYDLNDVSNSSYTSDVNSNGYIDGGDLLNDSSWENGTDEDSNGYIDDLIGWDFANNDNDPYDDNAHGTHCAGTIAGIGDNATGVAGVNWVGQVAGLKFLTGGGSGSTSDAVSAVNYAANIRSNGGNLIATSNSWGGGGYSASLETAIIAAQAEDQLFIAAAGNSGAASPSYPALYPQSNIISVAATDRTDTIASFSQYGTTTVDLAAPGVAIWSTTPGNNYASYNGTSMATPHVAGAVALLYSYKPTATWTEVRDAIYVSVETASTHANLSSLAGKMVTEGRLHLRGALDALGPAGPGPGSVTFDATKYASDATATVTVADADRNLDDAAADTVTVLVSSTT